MPAVPNEAEAFAEGIKSTREALGLTQEEWAQRLGVSVRTVSRWESGASQPTSHSQKTAVAQAVASAGLGDTLGKMGLAGWLGVGAAALMLGPFGAMMVPSALQGMSRAAAYRAKSEVLSRIEQSAERFGVAPDSAFAMHLVMVDAAIRAKMTLKDLRDLLAENVTD